MRFIFYLTLPSMSFFGVQLNSQVNRLMFEIRLHLSRDKFAPNFRTIYRAFAEFDKEVSGSIHPIQFEKALNSNGIFFKKYQIQAFEKAYKNETGKINWFDFLSHLKEPMGPARRQLVESIFDSMDQEKAGKISVEKLISNFNPSEIQAFKHGKKSREMIENQLLSLLVVNDGCITKEQFVGFYDDQNINFVHNDVFFRFVSVQWHYTLEKQQEATEEQIKAGIKALRYKILQKSQATKDEYLLNKLYAEFDFNKNGCLGAYEVDLMMKKLEVAVSAKVVGPILERLDRNKSGYLEFDDFKELVFRDPYPI